MYNKTILIASLLLVLSGCANTGYVENTQIDNYWYGPDKEQMKITGKYFQLPATFKLLINDEMVIDGRTLSFSGNEEFHSEYKGMPVDVSCKFAIVNGLMTCVVDVDNSYATTLKFDGTGLIGW